MARRFASLLLCAAVSGCSGGDAVPADADGADAGIDAGGEPAAGDALYDDARLLDVRVTLGAADFAALAREGRSLPAVMSGCDDPAFQYTVFPGEATIDGTTLAQVGVRKKGYLGSLSVARPSLRVDLAEYVPEQRLDGQRYLTLNNSRQDASLLHQCLAYLVFERAGVPAPRCSFARVSVNGASLGAYVNVEPIKKPMLRRHFADDSGDLYEGSSGADFRDEMLAAFEKKTNESDPSRAGLEAVAAALRSSGKDMLDAVDPLVDVDELLRFWAVESLVAHWDGYSGNLNNFFVYHDPSSDRLVFLPWGTDGAFGKEHPFLPPGSRPPVTYAWARLPARLYAYAPTRERYRQALSALLDEVWDEEVLLAKIDVWAALLGDAPDAAEVEALRAFVRGRRAEVRAELDAAAIDWEIPERFEGGCDPSAVTDVSGTFATTYGTLDALQPDPAATVMLQLPGVPSALSGLLSAAGQSTDAAMIGPAIRLVQLQPDGGLMLAQVGLGPAPLVASEIPFHGFETFGFAGSGSSPSTFRIAGLIGEGTITLSRAAEQSGAPVEGHFEGKLVRFGLDRALQ